MKILTIIVLSFLTACGFQPLYGERGGVQETNIQLQHVFIANIPDREGQYLRNALIDRFYRTGRPVDPAYTLRITSLNESKRDLDVTIDSDATRGQLKLTASMVLTDNQTGQALLNRSLMAVTSYNILASEFTNRVSEQNARENALNDLARQIEMQLGLYFSR